MTTTADDDTTTAIAEREKTPTDIIEDYRADFALVLPSHIKPETWVRLAQGVCRRDQNLRRAATENPGSFLVALLDAARLGLEPGTEQYYLTPRTRAGQLEVLGIRGYQGEVELIYRAGAVSSVIVEVVREKDTFSYTPGRDDRPVHEIDWDLPDRGELRLVYAYAVMKDGATSKVVVLNHSHIATAKASSQGSSSAYSPWMKHEEAMWLKTAVHRLAKWIPTSAEYRREVMRSTAQAEHVATAAGLAPAIDAPDGVDTATGEIADDVEVVDAELVPDVP